MLVICCLLFKDNFSCWSRNSQMIKLDRMILDFQKILQIHISYILYTYFEIRLNFYIDIALYGYDYEKKVHIQQETYISYYIKQMRKVNKIFLYYSLCIYSSGVQSRVHSKKEIAYHNIFIISIW